MSRRHEMDRGVAGVCLLVTGVLILVYLSVQLLGCTWDYTEPYMFYY
jgi:hypothetical protein